MTLALFNGTQPEGLVVNTMTFPFPGEKTVVLLGDYEISLEDFLYTAWFVLSNTELAPKDPRLQFIKCIKRARRVDRFKPGMKRLTSSESPVAIRRPKKVKS
jgi:hypothetical protein